MKSVKVRCNRESWIGPWWHQNCASWDEANHFFERHELFLIIILWVVGHEKAVLKNEVELVPPDAFVLNSREQKSAKQRSQTVHKLKLTRFFFKYPRIFTLEISRCLDVNSSHLTKLFFSSSVIVIFVGREIFLITNFWAIIVAAQIFSS